MTDTYRRTLAPAAAAATDVSFTIIRYRHTIDRLAHRFVTEYGFIATRQTYSPFHPDIIMQLSTNGVKLPINDIRKSAFARIEFYLQCAVLDAIIFLCYSATLINPSKVTRCLIRHEYTKKKVVTTLVIRPFDDHTDCARYVLTHSGFGESCTIVHCITSQPANVPPVS